LDEALQHCENVFPNTAIFVVGGARFFETAMSHAACTTIFQTCIPGNWNCNCLFERQLLRNFNLKAQLDLRFVSGSIDCRFPKRVKKWERNQVDLNEWPLVLENQDEERYLALLRKLLLKAEMEGAKIPNRTGVSCVELLCKTLQFNLSDHTLPLLTSKRCAFKSILVELLWFMRGDKNIDFLHKHGVHIWDANTSREALKKRKLDHLQPGECGPIYGSQWRNFNSQGSCDQLQRVVDGLHRLRLDPSDAEARRLLIVAFNPVQLHLMALPPCHVLVQFHADVQRNQLSCMVTMRSADLPLGVPFNICSYALLTFIVAHLTHFDAHQLCITMNICHAYENQLDGIRQQLTQPVFCFPKLRFSNRFLEFETLQEVTSQSEPKDFILENYFHSDEVVYPMSA